MLFPPSFRSLSNLFRKRELLPHASPVWQFSFWVFWGPARARHPQLQSLRAWDLNRITSRQNVLVQATLWCRLVQSILLCLKYFRRRTLVHMTFWCRLDDWWRAHCHMYEVFRCLWSAFFLVRPLQLSERGPHKFILNLCSTIFEAGPGGIPGANWCCKRRCRCSW